MPTTKQRISINLPDDEYAELFAMAEKHSISMAWIGRKAIHDFVERYRDGPLQLPLTFTDRGEQPQWFNKQPE
jgi:predicted transcriptional regulator